MKITDRQIAVFSLIVAVGALYYGWSASRQNNLIIAHTKEIKNKIQTT